ncbi:MAG TPA: hypothetical protein DD676_08900 [Halomonas sp.]|nr:hypothetical protein [Halomonas sp.]
MYYGVAWQRLRDPRQDRYFNVLKQAGHYDPKGLYVAYWLPAPILCPSGLGVVSPSFLSHHPAHAKDC